MIVLPGIARLVESLYAPERDDLSWLEQIRETGERAFDGALNCQLTMLHVRPDTRPRVAHIVGPPALNEHALRMLEAATTEDIAHLYFSGPLVWASDVVRQSPNPELKRLFQGGKKRHGLPDGLGVVATDSDGACLVLAFSLASARLPSRTRITLLRLAGQLVTAHRLRRGAGLRAAVLSTTGEAESVMELDSGDVGALRRAALSLDRAKRVAPHEPTRALGYWKALVEGRWTLVERFETDGRRILVAYENEPGTAFLRKLNENERKVVTLAALSHPLKLVAYELGYAESTTSELLSSALAKLGLASRFDLIRLASALGAVPTGPLPQGNRDLSNAELSP